MKRLAMATGIGSLVLAVGFCLGGWPLIVLSGIALFLVGGLGFPDVSIHDRERRG